MPASEPTLTIEAPIKVGKGSRRLLILVVFDNVPPDGTFSFSVPGPDSDNTIAVPQSPLPLSLSIGFFVEYPSQFTTTAALNYWQGAITPPPDPHITIQVIVPIEGARADKPTILRQGTASVF